MALALIKLDPDKNVATIDSDNISQYEVKYDFSKEELNISDPLGDEFLSNYIISEELVNAVNAAIVTGRPLLLKGDPGCGKTKLAKAVAYYFFEKETNKYYFEWFIKSKSQAKAGCYNFDHIQRLRDATVGVKNKEGAVDLKATNYLRMGPLGKALVTEVPELTKQSGRKMLGNRKAILLIDEIDKGDIDFPNDLLLELDELRFSIEEMEDKHIAAKKGNLPLVFITSNDERELPPAFMRRCLFYRIPSFSKEILEKIALSKIKDLYSELGIDQKNVLDEEKMKMIIDKFEQIRRVSVAAAAPSTSELLDWIKLIAFRLNNDEFLEDLIEDKQLQNLALKIM